ncbi:sensor histidine kinase [Streptomyces sp. NPDC092296]|uniref:sensor histidine kinase n=1 Tax=Streptomyces sp. NPDC092296 TaxID=3366012 RepID=UPI003811B2AF
MTPADRRTHTVRRRPTAPAHRGTTVPVPPYPRALMRTLIGPAADHRPLLADARRRWLRLLPYLVAVTLISSLLPSTTVLLARDYGLNSGIAGGLATAQTVPLLLAISRPRAGWVITATANLLTALAVLTTTDHGAPWPWTPPAVVGYLFLMLALALRERRSTLVAVWLATGAAGFGVDLVVPTRTGTGMSVIAFTLSGAVLLLGGALRERAEAQRRLTEQEHISEAERGRRTLLEERARIARELHDVVAHHMSVITVQADSAPYRIDGLSDAAREEFASIGVAARESLSEMRRLLGVLRSEDTRGERAPQPGLDRLPQLVEAVGRAGVPAELSVADSVRALGPLPQAVDLSAYRIVQEALANVIRHAPGAHTWVSATGSGTVAGGGALRITVVNGAPPRSSPPLEPAADGTGQGLLGMRERLRLLGGRLDVGPLPDGGFRVAAVLPLAAPGTETRKAETPTADTPMTGTPTTDTPTTGAPKAAAPAHGTPTAGPPAEEQPVTDDR